MSTPSPSPSPQESRLTTPDTLALVQGLSQLHDSVAVLDPQGRLLWLSDGLAARCGAPESLRGRSWLELLSTRGDARRLAQQLLRTGRLSGEPVTLRGRDGHEVPARVSAARIGKAHQPGPTVAILRVDSEPTGASEEFRHTVLSLGAVLDGAPDGVVIVDESRFISYANPAMAELTGWSEEELVDKPLALFLRSHDDVEQIAAALIPGSPVRSHDLEVRHKDGRTLCASVSVSLLARRDGTPMGAVAYVRDVTGRRRFEEDLARKAAELEHYVDAVSHDLRSPLMSLLGFSRLLREDYGERLDDKGRHFLKRIEEAGRTMEDLIRNLLELSRIGKTGPSAERVDLREVLLQLKAELKPRLDTQSVDFEIPGSPPLLCCDRTRLYQVVSNLVGNALDHMGPVARPAIHVDVAEEGSFHVISVRDNGCGIDPAHHARIFELFQSLGPRRDGLRGTGIGLAIVKKIAETQGGRAWVESLPGEGATFRVALPRA